MTLFRIRAISLLIGALGGAAVMPACRRTTEPAVTLQMRARLLSELPQETRQRVQQLLARGYNHCPAGPFKAVPPLFDPEPAHIQELKHKTALLQREGKTGQMNCLATVNWIITGEESAAILDALSFLDRLTTAGFSRQREYNLFEVDEEGLAQRLLIDFTREKLTAGDILVFERDSVEARRVDNNTIAHAALYLGKIAGRHYMFQKWNAFCGEDSPYEIIALDLFVVRRLSWPVNGLDDGSFRRLVVYRRQ